MNEEHINSIIGYFEHYPDLPQEKLAAHILESGYPMTDLKEALRRMSISPIIIPGYQEPEPAAIPMYSKPSVVIVGGAVLFFCIALGSAYLLFGKKSEPKKLAGRMQQTLIEISPTAFLKAITPVAAHISPNTFTASGSATVDDPFKIFKDTFAQSDYKIGIDTTEESPAYSGNPAGSSHDVTTAYTKKGRLVRFEEGDEITLYKGNDTYRLSPMFKIYTILPSNGGVQMANLSFIPTAIISQSQQGNIEWQKKTNSIWVGRWNVDSTKPDAWASIEATIDEKTHLLQKIAVRSNLTKSVQVIKLSYEKISNIDAFLTVPSGYTKKS